MTNKKKVFADKVRIHKETYNFPTKPKKTKKKDRTSD